MGKDKEPGTNGKMGKEKRKKELMLLRDLAYPVSLGCQKTLNKK
jgi:hypothetical protein